MTNLAVLKTDKVSAMQHAKEVLQDAIKQDFETVLIVGIKDGRIITRHTTTIGVLEKIGMIETCKLELWSGWK